MVVKLKMNKMLYIVLLALAVLMVPVSVSAAEVVEAAVLSESGFNTDATLTAFYDAVESFPGEIVAAKVRWFQNDNEITFLEDKPQVLPKDTKVGDVWHFKVNVYDGKTWTRAVFSQKVEIQAKVVTTEAVPFPVVIDYVLVSDNGLYNADSKLTASYNYFEHKEGQVVSVDLVWLKNGKEVSSLKNVPTVKSDLVKSGDVWQFKVRLSDGNAWGDWVYSEKEMIQAKETVTEEVLKDSLPFPVVKNVAIKADDITKDTYDFTTKAKLIADYSVQEWAPGQVVGAEIVWELNGREVPSLNDKPVISPELTKVGQVWQFKLRIFDGNTWSQWLHSQKVLITKALGL